MFKKLKDTFNIHLHKSIIILIALITLFLISAVSLSYMAADIKKYNTDDVALINKLGQIRGSIQRYAKLKLSRSNSTIVKLLLENIDSVIKKRFVEVNQIILNNQVMKHYAEKNHLFQNIEKTRNCWLNLKKSDIETIIPISETCWEIADTTTTIAQKTAEEKNANLISKVILLRNLISIIILILAGFIYFYIRKDLEKKATFDQLTLLYNRNKLETHFEQQINKSRKEGKPLSILMLDIDYFKKINDTYGHTKGDEVLSKVAQIIKNSIRDTDFAFRYGGEEFLIILPSIGKEKAYRIAERIREAVQNTNFGLKREVTVSCGVTEYKVGETIKETIDRADKALYLSKKQGRNRTTIL